jgi:Type II transport protein GspH
VTTSPARGPQGPGPLRPDAGLSIFELLLGMTTLAGMLAIATPGVMRLRDEVSLRSAVHETSVAFYLARSYAISQNRNVGLKFRRNGDRYEWALYADGNGNGVRTGEIASGVDRFLGVTYPWTRNDVMPGIMTGTRVPDPGSPGHYLDHPEDPIRFNASDICSFSSMGESTPGSVYLWNAHDRMAVLRVFGRTAKLRSLYYRRGDREWKP